MIDGRVRGQDGLAVRTKQGRLVDRRDIELLVTGVDELAIDVVVDAVEIAVRVTVHAFPPELAILADRALAQSVHGRQDLEDLGPVFVHVFEHVHERRAELRLFVRPTTGALLVVGLDGPETVVDDPDDQVGQGNVDEISALSAELLPEGDALGLVRVPILLRGHVPLLLPGQILGLVVGVRVLDVDADAPELVGVEQVLLTDRASDGGVRCGGHGRLHLLPVRLGTGFETEMTKDTIYV